MLLDRSVPQPDDFVRRSSADRALSVALQERVAETSAGYRSRLREELEKSASWPADYLYKFIVPTDSDKAGRIEALFDNTGAVIESKQSRNGKYTSLSITVNLDNPDAVIEKYREVGAIPGVISL